MSTKVLATKATRQLNAVVVSSGLMQKTVKVRIGVQKWDNHIRKHFNRHTHLLVHDPRSSLRTGDIISISPGWRTSKMVRHVVNSIIAPFGEPVENRPPVPSEEERLAEREGKLRAKREMRREKKAAEKEVVRGEGKGKGKGEKLVGENAVEGEEVGGVTREGKVIL